MESGSYLAVIKVVGVGGGGTNAGGTTTQAVRGAYELKGTPTGGT